MQLLYAVPAENKYPRLLRGLQQQLRGRPEGGDEAVPNRYWRDGFGARLCQ